MSDALMFWNLRRLLLLRAGNDMESRCRIVRMTPFETYAAAREIGR